MLNQRCSKTFTVSFGVDKQGVDIFLCDSHESHGLPLSVGGNPKLGHGQILFAHDDCEGLIIHL